jgi:hypothetical protein
MLNMNRSKVTPLEVLEDGHVIRFLLKGQLLLKEIPIAR